MCQGAVTLEVVKLLILNQTNAFKSTFAILRQNVKGELKAIKSEINNLKAILQFTQAQFEDDWNMRNAWIE